MLKVLVVILLGTGVLASIFLGFLTNLPKLTFANTQNQTASKEELPKVEKGEVEVSLQRLSPIKFLPDHTLYFLIALKEKFDYFRQPNKVKKALFDVKLTGKRIKEAYLLEEKGEIKKATESLKNYQRVSLRLQKELPEATNSGQAVFETQQLLADNLERHLKIIIVLAQINQDSEFRKELAESVWVIGSSTKLLEKNLPDASLRILQLSEKTRIVP